MLKKILLALTLLVLVLLGVIATRPATFAVERSAKMSAPPEVVYAQLDDFHRWAAWSPWERLDPGMKREFPGAASGVGAAYAWVGNKDVGEGRMTITDAKPPESLTIKLEFIKPFAGVSTTLFTVKPDGEGSTVTWRMSGENGFLGKAFSLVMDNEKMIGPDFEKGLAAMKAVAEAEAKKRAEAPKPEAAPAAPTAP